MSDNHSRSNHYNIEGVSDTRRILINIILCYVLSGAALYVFTATYLSSSLPYALPVQVVSPATDIFTLITNTVQGLLWLSGVVFTLSIYVLGSVYFCAVRRFSVFVAGILALMLFVPSTTVLSLFLFAQILNVVM